AQVELPATHHHVVEKGIERELIFARPPRNYLSYPRTMPADEQGSRRGAAVARIGGEQPQKVALVRFRCLVCIQPPLLAVMLGGRLGALCGGLGPLAGQAQTRRDGQ